MNEEIKDEIFQLNFQIEVSARYHDWLRARYETLSAWTKFISIVGAALALIGVFAEQWSAYVIAISAAFIALVNLCDLVFNFDGKARQETALYERFKTLQAAIVREHAPNSSQIREWEADAQIIRKDELPTFWALYALSWNQAVKKRNLDWKEWALRVGPAQPTIGWVRHYLPSDFPPLGRLLVKRKYLFASALSV